MSITILELPIENKEEMEKLLGKKYSPYQKSILGSLLGVFSNESRGGLMPAHYESLREQYPNIVILVPGELSTARLSYEALGPYLSAHPEIHGGIIDSVKKTLEMQPAIKFSVIPTHHFINDKKVSINRAELDMAIATKCFYYVANNTDITFAIPYLSKKSKLGLEEYNGFNTQYFPDIEVVLQPSLPEFGTHSGLTFKKDHLNYLDKCFQRLAAYSKSFSETFPDLDAISSIDIINHALNFSRVEEPYAFAPKVGLNDLQIAAILRGHQNRNKIREFDYSEAGSSFADELALIKQVRGERDLLAAPSEASLGLPRKSY